MAAEINQLKVTQSNTHKRVLFVITQSEMGGAQRFIYNFLSNLDQSKFEIKVLIGADGDGDLTARLNKINVSTTTVSSLRRNISLMDDIRAIRELRDEITKFKPQTLFLSSSKAGFLASMASVFPRRLDNIRIVYRIGGWTFNDPWSLPIKKLWIFLERISARWKDIIIVNNSSDFIQARELGIKPKSKIVLIHNGIDPYKLDLFDKETARSYILKNIPEKSPRKIIGTIANFYPSKGLEYLIKSARYFSDADQFHIAIVGDGALRPELERIIRDEKLESKVTLVGSLPDAYRYLNAFDVFVLPSIKEGFSWALIEAMSAHVPVITTLTGAATEIIEDGKNGFVIPAKRPDLIALKVREILQNENLKKEFIIQGHQTVLFKFSADKMIKSTEHLL